MLYSIGRHCDRVCPVFPATNKLTDLEIIHGYAGGRGVISEKIKNVISTSRTVTTNTKYT